MMQRLETPSRRFFPLFKNKFHGLVLFVCLLVFGEAALQKAPMPWGCAAICHYMLKFCGFKKSGHPAFDIEEPHWVESSTVERTQLIVGCAGPREDVSCCIITSALQGDRVMEIPLI